MVQEDLRRFVASRNRLVHEGCFYSEKASGMERGGLRPLGSLQEEWFWLVHFVDRLVLAAIGYYGEYIDWSRPESLTTGVLLPSV